MNTKRILSVVMTIVIVGLLAGSSGTAPLARIGSLTAWDAGLPVASIEWTGRADFNSWEFLTSVGGILFETEARPADGLHVRTISARYEPQNPDGRRLVLTINGIDYPADLYDWKLAPIVAYVSSSTYACFSLYGPNYSDKEFRPIYHPAFRNNLLGTRLLQMDSHFEPEIYGREAVDADTGEILKGPGEEDVANIKLHKAYRRFVAPHRRTSYVIHDLESDITFSIDAPGEPFCLNGPLSMYNWKIQFDETGFYGEPVTALNDQITTINDLLYRINPDTYDTVCDIMHYAALFRYLRRMEEENGGDSWNRLVRSVAGVPTFEVRNPNLIHRYERR
jgi:hypothetical protein